MGQKVHPLGFRLGITQEHKCQWFEEMKTYPNTVYQDFVLRNCILNNFKNADITSIHIERSLNQVVVKVVAARSRLLTSNLDQITKHLNVLLKLMTLARDNETKLLVPKESTSSSEGKTNHNNYKNTFGSGKQNHTPLVSPVLLANTNITDGSLSTLNKWNGKISQALRISLIQKNALHFIGLPYTELAPGSAYPKGTSIPLRGTQTKENENADNTLKGQQSTEVEDVKLSDTSPPENFEEENFFENEPRLTLLVGSSSQETISNSAFLTAKTIQEQLEKRVPFRRAVKVALRRGSTPKGIKIQVSGRLNGAEIARSEWIRQGRVPLHTLRAQVDYCSHQARTQYGILGIKVWIFQGYKESL